MPAVVIRTCYDGDQIGEVSHFTRNLEQHCGDNLDDGTSTKMREYYREMLDLKNRDNSLFERKIDISENMMKDLTQKEVNKLNEQRTTATTMEPCDLLYIDKLQSMIIIGKGMQDEEFSERLHFLWKTDLFKGINRNHLLPLITNLDVRFYRKGEYIQR